MCYIVHGIKSDLVLCRFATCLPRVTVAEFNECRMLDANRTEYLLMTTAKDGHPMKKFTWGRFALLSVFVVDCISVQSVLCYSFCVLMFVLSR